ncbi:GntR family transcriptional regulator [Aureimonas ureilytica]|uniref:GntR family transcriptional regulator n=2 Tax=Aureimonas ureilytica TaxID=401562 RepID=A0A175R964_9HYPH|nr:GntR family transcriptional regulator [Aureimonas ureilytica]
MSDQFPFVWTADLDGLLPLPPMDRLRDTLDALGRFVEGSGLKAGDRLPAERELMQALGVGRSTIREAARQLQALGVVETRKGSGSYLLRPISAATIHMPLSITATGLREALLQTLDIRRGLEAEASALAAIRHTADDLARMSERLVEMERVHRLNGTAGPEDLLFHLSIYDAAQNPLFRQLLEQMREAFERFFTKPFDRPDFAGRSFPLHREMFDAIAARDPGLAREKTLAILDIVEEDIKDMSQ